MVAAKIVKDDDGNYNYLQGEVSIPVDSESILKTIDALEKCNAGAWVALALNNDIPADPFNRKLIKPVLMGVLQNAWYQEFNETGIPEKCLVNQETRVKKYLEDLEKFKANPAGVSSLSEKEPRSPRTAKSYRLVEAKRADWEKFKGQKKLIIDAMVSMGAVGSSGGVSTATIADAIKDKLETKQPAERVVAFYMNTFGHDGITETPGEQSSISAPADSAAPAAETAKPVEKPAEPAEKPGPRAKGTKPAKAASKKK